MSKNKDSWLDQYYKVNEVERKDGLELYAKLSHEAKQQILQAIKDKAPKLHNRKLDEEYSYCITCNQIVDDKDSDCFCTIHNLAIKDFLEQLGIED